MLLEDVRELSAANTVRTNTKELLSAHRTVMNDGSLMNNQALLAEAEEHKKASVSLHAHAAALQTKADLAQAHHPADPEPLPNLF